MPTAGGAPSWTTVENLVEQRSRSFEYLKRVQQGDTHWLSTVALGPQEQPLHKGVDATTVLRWFYLGLSIGPLLQLQSGPPFVKAVLQLLGSLRQPLRARKFTLRFAKVRSSTERRAGVFSRYPSMDTISNRPEISPLPNYQGGGSHPPAPVKRNIITKIDQNRSIRICCAFSYF